MSQEVFVSLDVETLGPIPGKNPMVELGAACFDITGTILGTYQVRLSNDIWEPDSATMKWWMAPENFSSYQRLLENQQHPRDVMPKFYHWLNELPLPLTPVAYPAGFDYMFVYWYMMYYLGTATPFSFSCLDIKSYAMAALKNISYRKTIKKKFPRSWFHPNLKHTHCALDDALEQGWTFLQAYRQNLGLSLLNQAALNDLRA